MTTAGRVTFIAPVYQGTECTSATLINAWGPPQPPQNRLGYPPVLVPIIAPGRFRVTTTVVCHAEGAGGTVQFAIGWRDSASANFAILPRVEEREIAADQLETMCACTVEMDVDLGPTDVPTRLVEFSLFWAYQSPGGMLVACQDEGSITWEVVGPE